MNHDFTEILASKQKFRHALATRDITEKLRMLDALRERALLLGAYPCQSVRVQTVAEESAAYSSKASRK